MFGNALFLGFRLQDLLRESGIGSGSALPQGAYRGFRVLSHNPCCCMTDKVLGFRGLGFRDLGFRDLGFRDLGFRV